MRRSFWFWFVALVGLFGCASTTEVMRDPVFEPLLEARRQVQTTAATAKGTAERRATAEREDATAQAAAKEATERLVRSLEGVVETLRQEIAVSKPPAPAPAPAAKAPEPPLPELGPVGVLRVTAFDRGQIAVVGTWPSGFQPSVETVAGNLTIVVRFPNGMSVLDSTQAGTLPACFQFGPDFLIAKRVDCPK